MGRMAKLGLGSAVAGAAMLMAAPVFADGYYGGGSAKEMAAAPAAASDWTFSANVALTTDYVFRGISQTDENAAIQGGFDVAYKKLYAGVWASNLDFGGDGLGNDIANIEIDVYGGIKPTYGKFTFDFGVIGYLYPNANDGGAELDYVEFKAGVSTTVFEKIAVGGVMFFSPDNTGEIGENFVFEGTAGYTFSKVWMFTPTLSGLIGFQEGEESEGGFDYTYWNVGMNFAFGEKPVFSFDIRYWDTDLSDTTSCSGPIFQCDERVVGTVKAVF